VSISGPRSQAGVAAAVASTSRQVGASLGVAIVGAVVSSGAGTSIRTHFSQASHAGWWIVVGCGATVILLALVSTGRWAASSVSRIADLLEEGAANGGAGVAMMKR
jgi:hypothetical protein